MMYKNIFPLLMALTFIGCSNEPLRTQDNSANQPTNKYTGEKVVKTSAEWNEILSNEEYEVLREKGTERPFTGEYNSYKRDGIYVCNGCGLPLFDSSTKFDSGTGWPSFYQPINDINVGDVPDNAYGMRRIEVVCNRCEGHLGHVFNDGPEPTGLRYCINSVSLEFKNRE